MNKDQWDTRFLDLAQLVASWSEDKSRKVGAVIVGEANQILATGYNGLPRGVSADHSKRHSSDDDEKYFWYEHAERNAIFNAARSGVRLEGATIYSTLFPCAECSRAIIQSGLQVLKTNKIPINDATYRRSFEVSKQLLTEGGIRIRIFD